MIDEFVLVKARNISDFFSMSLLSSFDAAYSPVVSSLQAKIDPIDRAKQDGFLSSDLKLPPMNRFVYEIVP